MKEIFLDKLLSYLLSLILGGIITIILFFFTSPPTSPKEIKKKLLDITLAKIKNRYGKSTTDTNIDTIFSDDLEVGAEKSIIIVGSTKLNDKIYRWISVFERNSTNIIDKLVGRSGFYKLTSLTSFEAYYSNSLMVDKIESIDFDKDGTSELHIRIKSIWADSTSVGPLILSKGSTKEWQLYALPLISQALNMPLKNPEMRGRLPYNFFGMFSDDDIEPKSTAELKLLPLFEEVWVVNHNGKEQNITTLRNGGDYIFRNHVIKGYSQIQTLTFFDDGGAILGPHYAVVNMFNIGEKGIETDDLWNWEQPMYSTRALRLLDIDLDSISKAGIAAHTEGDVFYGYTEFEKIRIR